MSHELLDLPELRFAGMAVDCPNYDTSAVPSLWESFMQRWGEVTDGKGVWGVSLPARDGFRYLAALNLDELGELPDGFEAYTLPAGKYLKLPFKGAPEGIGSEFQRILHDLLPSLGLAAASGFHCLEEYLPNDSHGQGGGFNTNLYVELKLPTVA